MRERTDTDTRHEPGCPDCTDGLGASAPVEPGGWRDRIRRRPGPRLAWRVGVFATGLVCIAVGLALAVLPGPLTIPPVLLGLWVWSTEFAWARRFFETFSRKAKEAWRHAKLHPVSSSVVTLGGIAVVAAVIWAVGHYRLVDQARDLIGI